MYVYARAPQHLEYRVVKGHSVLRECRKNVIVIIILGDCKDAQKSSLQDKASTLQNAKIIRHRR